ncbi:DAO-domain-containing protein [Coprinopsis marcescibilis]|uniref:DAO-domain-containing protein n=1 Tax=Coprinopsis marcescibilis TaxID=230819 RepID=A0A5C3KP10_COPMA|nr:DAO-domain-containing protein [Coprinopsis marcescibilis]
MSSFLLALKALLRHILLRLLRAVYPPLNDVCIRVQKSPGLPVPNPTSSYWLQTPSPIAKHNADPSVPLPEYADIVIIGSGITGTSFARTILDYKSGHDVLGAPLKIVMLDARDTCSGATGRNGGHVTPVLYQEYSDIKAVHGKDMAQKIIRFRLAHISQTLQVAKEENLLDDSQGREVEAFDVFFDKGLFRKAKLLLKEFQADLPDESTDYKICETREELDKLQLSKSIVGCFSTRAGAIHPYRLVTGILARLLTSYPDSFDIYSHTPCTQITSPDDSDNCYTALTPRGKIRAHHIVHASNGWVSHLLPGMRGIIFPSRGCMTAQIPRKGLGSIPPELSNNAQSKPALYDASSWTGNRSFVIYPKSNVGTYDYLTQQTSSTGPHTMYPQPRGELMLGGGFTQSLATEVGTADDSECNARVSGYLSTALRRVFSVSGGADEDKEDVVATWSGVLGLSADEMPWVGRIPEKITGRSLGRKDTKSEGSPNGQGLASSGEWIAAGYSGEGMVHAWLSGKALGWMVLGLDLDSPVAGDETRSRRDSKPGLEWFPEVFRITEERWKRAEFEDLMGTF